MFVGWRSCCSRRDDLALNRGWRTIEVGIKEVFDGSSIVENSKGGLLRRKKTGTTPDNLFEFDDGANTTGQHNVLAGRHIHACTQQTGCRYNHWQSLPRRAKLTERSFPLAAIVIDDARDIPRPDPVHTSLFQGHAHLICMIIIDTKHNGFLRARLSLSAEILCQMLCNRLGILAHGVASLHNNLLIQRLLRLALCVLRLCTLCYATNLDAAHAIWSQVAI